MTLVHMLMPLLLLSLVRSAAAQSNGGRLQERFAPEDARKLGGLIDSLAAAGAPADPLVLKALEGASKGAAPSRIESAVRSLGRGLLEARAALGPSPEPGEIAAGAAALRAGAPPAALTAIRAARPSGTVSLPLGTMADLLARGVPADRAQQVVVQLVRQGAVDAEFGAVANTVVDVTRSGEGAGSMPAPKGKVRPVGKAPPGPPAGIPGNGSRNDPPGRATTGGGSAGGLAAPPGPRRPPSAGNGNGKGRSPSNP